METVNDLLRLKQGRDVHTIAPDATALQATHCMNEHSIGALVVIEDGRMVGMFTERDVLRRVVGELKDPSDVRVADVMTTQVACCLPETSIDEAKAAMKNRRIRHMPVVNDGEEVLGLISIGDLNAYDSTNQESTIHFLHEYLHGRV